MDAHWKEVLPQLAGVGGLLDQAREVSLPAHSIVFHHGDRCRHYMLVMEGAVKVLTRALNGREIVLYRLGAGDSCVLATSCLFGNSRYPAEGITETAVTALTLPAVVFERALQDSAAFREFVFHSFAAHLASVIGLLEEVAFGRLDSRLARQLLEDCDAEMVLRTTHQTLATELGSTREVISRLLREMAVQGRLELHRGSIRILDRAALAG
ncbi:MAG TPA: Crp/Fnr family transcriptional regulator [Gammaproteobacteria bacterium]|nr:Crp/Fnr family transcriptional regulator [Gammaproteobacteria bacterium]